MPEWTVTAEDAGAGPLEFLQRRVPAAPAAYLRQLLRSGRVRRAGAPLAEAMVLAVGDEILLPDSRRLQELLGRPGQEDLVILYESAQILVLDKPAGLATHAGKGHEADNLTSRAEALLKSRGQQYMTAPIQRLDLETSGPVLFGKGRKSCSVLGRLMMAGSISKTYLALVDGRLTGGARLHSQVPAKGTYKSAETAYQRLSGSAAATLVQIELHTGRQHQIRRQFSDIGHPLFGDRRYRGRCPAQLPRLFLHCCQLSFTDPFADQPLTVRSPLPAELRDFLGHLGLPLPDLA
ncbi:MAG: RluA family pseudouridine synthase [Pelovirga sp.]